MFKFHNISSVNHFLSDDTTSCDENHEDDEDDEEDGSFVTSRWDSKGVGGFADEWGRGDAFVDAQDDEIVFVIEAGVEVTKEDGA